MLNYDELYDSELYKVWNNTTQKKVSELAEEPITGLLWIEFEYLIDNITFSHKKIYDRILKFLLRLHALGISDKKISEGFYAYSHFKIKANTIYKMRQKCLNKINTFYGKEIGLISLLSETFKGSFDISTVEYDAVVNKKSKNK